VRGLSTRLGAIPRCTIVAVVIAITVAATESFAWAGTQDVINSPHNLSVSGTGPVTSSQSQVCVFCHAPHNVSVDMKPLWNRALPTQSYTAYSSTTMSGSPQQPSTISKQCLSCHDGTIALG
jgi:hypothetical protein